ncbi:MAG: FKBP-type peptidyl-prolyl cis-trans isomerase [Candidatus Saccharibacteria bacterium]|nr:FKBP-type peptidyl-prolyl cis-trans isomerase [Candidatus Saccharibacteria bacterium]
MEKSSTSRAQKIVIWFIIVAMSIGSVGAYFVVIIANENQKRDTEKQAAAQKVAQKKAAEEAAKVKEPLDGYTAEAFDKATVTKLNVETLVAGTGKAAKKTSTVSANYFGWTSDGKIFDSSKKDGVTTPVSFPLNQVISGWTESLTGVKEGSVVKLTIPSDKAYGETGAPSGGIGPNEPLVFIVELKSVK